MAQRSEWVSSKVGSLQTGRTSASDVEFDLEMLVQSIDEAV